MATKVYSCDSAAEAHFICGLLRADAINAEVRGDALVAAAGVLPIFGGAEATVWIDDDLQLHRAETIIAARQQIVIGENWQCPHCHEMLEPQFTECWRCQQ